MANIFSKALLSLVMDKNARETLERRKKVLKDLKDGKPLEKPILKAAAKSAKRAAPATKKAAVQNGGLPKNAPQKNATLQPVLSAEGKVLKGVTKAEENDAMMLVERIARAEEAIVERQKTKKTLTGARGELIANALRIQKAKADVFGDLDDEQLRKLQGLAQKMMLGK